MPFLKHDRITPAQVVILGFLFQILIGACLLSLPVATRSGESVPFLDALFTATSATCVTGLVIHDTALFWSPFGQGVILLLIQVGGMGVVTMAVAIFMFSGRKIGLKQRWVMQESISAPQVGGIVRRTRFILDDGIHSQDRFSHRSHWGPAAGAAVLSPVWVGEGHLVWYFSRGLRLLQRGL